MRAPILQTLLPFTPWEDPGLNRLPGMVPVKGDWILTDEVYAAQIAERQRLMNTIPGKVLGTCPGSEAAQDEAVDTILAALPNGFERDARGISTPDGRVQPARPDFAGLSALIQEDILLLERVGDEHVLVAGMLCFPASWTLAEKLGRPLARIHKPVPDYPITPVQRMFDRLPPGRALWRANALGYSDPALYQPRQEAQPRKDGTRRYLRSERQTVLRMPRTGAILFAIHTWVIEPNNLTPHQRAHCPIPFETT